MERFFSPKVYPEIKIPLIKNPSRFYAFPILGILAKGVLLIPVGIELCFLWMIGIVISIINSFYVLFQGKYWRFAYEYNLGVMRLIVKVYYYVFGLTNKYPGFGFSINDDFTVDIPYPENPSKLFAIPILGGIIRFILLIPYFVYQQVISYAASIGAFVSFVPVLFMGFYPEATYELARDSVRVNQGSTAYFLGLSDKYPSFYISMNHKNAKIILIVLAILYMFFNFGNSFSSGRQNRYPTKSTIQYPSQNYYNPGSR